MEREVKKLIAYHIDKTGFLQPNDIVNTTPLKNIRLNDNVMSEQLEQFFPDGLTEHGTKYLTAVSDINHAGAITFETIYEYHRRIRFPDKNSRFNSHFAVTSLEEVSIWIEKLNLSNKKFNILKIDTLDSKVTSHDSGFLAGGPLASLENFTPLYVASWADQYWSGVISTTNHLPELLVEGRFKVLDIVTI